MGQAKQRGTFEERKAQAIEKKGFKSAIGYFSIPFNLESLRAILPTPITQQERQYYEHEVEEIRKNKRKTRRQNLKMKWTALLYNYWKQKRLGRA